MAIKGAQLKFIQSELVENVLDMVQRASPFACIVGGYVREWLRSRPTHDLDLVVPHDAIAIARSIADKIGGAFYVLDDEWEAARIVYSDYQVDIARIRGDDVTADLRARDFTINAMAVLARDASSPAPQVIDPFNGRRDLAAGIVRAVTAASFDQDPLRLLRAVRFASTLAFDIEPQTIVWIRRDAPLLVRVSAERVTSEVAQILRSPRSVQGVRRLADYGLLDVILPEIAALEHVRTDECSRLDEALGVLNAAAQWLPVPSPELDADLNRALNPLAGYLRSYFCRETSGARDRVTLLRLATLLQPLAGDEWCPLPSSTVGRERVEGALSRLRLSADEMQTIITCIVAAGRVCELAKQSVTRHDVYRYFRDHRGAGVDGVMLALAAATARRCATSLLSVATLLLDHYFVRPAEAVSPPRLITGQDVMELLQVQPGPRVGEVLERVREAQADGLVRTRDEALAFLRQWID